MSRCGSGDPTWCRAFGTTPLSGLHYKTPDSHRGQRQEPLDSRARLWKLELQRFADETGLILEVCHYPPGTSKWNKIEHRLFCHITRNWHGVPLETLQVVINLIGSTHFTNEDWRSTPWLDENTYEKGRKVSDAEMSELYIKRNTFHGDWNYEIHPRNSRRKIR